MHIHFLRALVMVGLGLGLGCGEDPEPRCDGAECMAACIDDGFLSGVCQSGSCQCLGPADGDADLDADADGDGDDAEELDGDRDLEGCDDAGCASLDSEPRCDELNRVVRQVGRCEAGEGCVAIDEVLEDCSDAIAHPESFECSEDGRSILRSGAVCLSDEAGPSCVDSSLVADDCADPLPEPYCDGSPERGELTFFSEPLCLDTGEPHCGQVTERCNDGASVCSEGVLTTNGATCDPTSGCGTATVTAACPTSDSRCFGLEFAEYFSECASASACSGGREERTSCAAPPAACVTRPREPDHVYFTQYAATCSPTEGCGTSVASETDCRELEGSACSGVNTLVTTCTCDVTEGCQCASEVRPCLLSSASSCADVDTVRHCTAGACDPATGDCGAAESCTDTDCDAGASCCNVTSPSPMTTCCAHGCCSSGGFPPTTYCCP